MDSTTLQELWTVEWTEDLLTGYEEVDEMHKEIVHLANELYGAIVVPGTKQEEIQKTIEELKYILISHLEIEAEIFKKYNLEDYERHVGLHEEIKREVERIGELELPFLVKTLMMNQLAVYYIKNHLVIEDKACIKELNQKRNENNN